MGLGWLLPACSSGSGLSALACHVLCRAADSLINRRSVQSFVALIPELILACAYCGTKLVLFPYRTQCRSDVCIGRSSQTLKFVATVCSREWITALIKPFMTTTFCL